MPLWIESWPLLPPLLLATLVWLVYWDVRKGEWVSDDIEGMAIYNGVWQTPKWQWANAVKKLRYEFGKVPNPNRDWKAQKQAPYLSHPQRHHDLSLWVGSGVLVALYALLVRLVGAPVAFLTCLLFLAHPLGVQCLGWISGIGYLLGYFFCFLGLNWALTASTAWWFQTPIGFLVGLGVYGLLQWCAAESMFSSAGVVFVLAALGLWPFAIVAGLVALVVGRSTFHSAITLRTSTFVEQQMAQSTKLYFRKAITVLKTVYYYAKLVVFPKRLGLYHTFGYHYELPYIEWEDKYCWGGLAVLALLGLGAWLGSPPVQLACVWWVAFGVIFWNWITAHQFVADRYMWAPALAVCLLVAAYAPPSLYWLLVGVALMRTWAHLPTYENHTRFYQSNIWNFPESEVAHGNLGIIYRDRGLVGSCLDTWVVGTKINPRYDVNWYNLSSHVRGNGPFTPNYSPALLAVCPPEVVQTALQQPQRAHLIIAHYCLKRAVEAPTCHFPQRWLQELAALEHQLASPLPPPPTLVQTLRIGTGAL